MPTSPSSSHPRAHLIGNPRSHLWLKAVHEAGHAVVCLAVGGTFSYATLRSTERGRIAAHVGGVKCPSPHLDAVVTCAGGLAQLHADQGAHAVNRVYGAIGASDSGCGDLGWLVELSKDETVDMDAAMRSAATATAVLKPLIEVAAAALMEPKPLRALGDLEIEAALGMRPGPWVAAAERLLDAESLDYSPPDKWLIRYVRERLDAV